MNAEEAEEGQPHPSNRDTNMKNELVDTCNRKLGSWSRKEGVIGGYRTPTDTLQQLLTSPGLHEEGSKRLLSHQRLRGA